MKINVYSAYSHISEKDLRGKVVVIVDTLRAASTIATALSNGCEQIFPVVDIEQAMELKDSMKEFGPLLGGERDGVKIPGFDLGNSPFEYTIERMHGKTLILTTSNGTMAIDAAKSASKVYIGSMINSAAVARAICKTTKEIVILCAGTNSKFSLDDILTAGYIIKYVSEEMLKSVDLDDLGRICVSLYNSNATDLIGAVRNASHAVVLNKLGCEKDIVYCLNKDIVKILPVFKDGRITV